MLIEILPFLRRIASSIQTRLGDDDPSLLPTVLVAYSMTSFLIGAVFVIMAFSRFGELVGIAIHIPKHSKRSLQVEYFPRTVLTGAIGIRIVIFLHLRIWLTVVTGAIGISLFLLGLELTLPSTAPVLTIKSAPELLFSLAHLPLLLIPIGLAAFLSISLRMRSLAKVTFGLTEDALYVPVYIFLMIGVFWTVVAGTHQANSADLESLAAQGWLFTIQHPPTKSHSSVTGTSWNYWELFDFPAVKWYAMTGAIQDTVFSVVIGVLDLPIYVPAMAISVDVSTYNMNHELFGHGVSNLLAGAVGTIPNLVVSLDL